MNPGTKILTTTGSGQSDPEYDSGVTRHNVPPWRQVIWLICMLAIAVGGGVGGPLPAAAHALPERFYPQRDSTLGAAPTEVRIILDGDVEPAFSAIQVTNAAGQRVDKGNGRIDERNRRLLRVGLGALGPGVYRVTWRILAIDGHWTEGAYVFTVKPSE